MKALVVSFSEVDFDHRVSASVLAFQQLGYEVHLVCLGGTSKADYTYYVGGQTWWNRAESYVLLLIGSALGDFEMFYSRRDWVRKAEQLLESLVSRIHFFEKVLVHDWEPLPLCLKRFPESKYYLDCHEYSFDESHNRFLKYSLDKYKKWLIYKHFKKNMSCATVSPYLSKEYEGRLDTEFNVIPNSHTLIYANESSTTTRTLNIGFSGHAGPRRSITRLFLLSLFTRKNIIFETFLLPRGGFWSKYVWFLAKFEKRFRVNGPLNRDFLVQTLSKMDYSIILNSTSNLNSKLASPNKFYEALSAGVPIIASNSTKVGELVDRASAGIVLPPSFLGQVYRLNKLSKSLAAGHRNNVPQLRALVSADFENSTGYKTWLSL